MTIHREILAARSMMSAAQRRAMGNKLAREVLAENMTAAHSLTEQCWKDMMDETLPIDKRMELRAEWRSLVALAADIAAKLAPYESPRLQSITVRRDDPYAAMTDAQLYTEMCRRAEALGVKLPAKPKLVNGTILDISPSKGG